MKSSYKYHVETKADISYIKAAATLFSDDKTRTLAFVEGKSDLLFFSNLINVNRCYCQPVSDGIIVKTSAKKLVCILTQEFLQEREGVIGMIDSDFGALDNKSYPENIVPTDVHDIETLIFQSSAWTCFLEKYGDSPKIATLEKLNNKDIRTMIINNTKFIGLYLYICLRDSIPVKFKDLDYFSFTDKKTFQIKEDTFIEHIIEKNSLENIILTTKESFIKYIINEITALNDKYSDINPYHLCRGHDIASYIHLGLTNFFGNTLSMHLNSRLKVERALYDTYNINYFSKTNMHGEIIKWEKNNWPFIVLNDNYLINHSPIKK